jgi:MFS family permease
MDVTNKKSLALRNAQTTIYNTFLISINFTRPIWQLFYTIQLGLTLTQAMILSMTTWIVSALANIPTGVLADKYGRVKLYRIGLMIEIICILPFFITNNFYILLLFSVIGGIGASMLSGSLDANVMDSYDNASISKKEYAKFISNHTISRYFGRIVSATAGSLLYIVNAFLPIAMNILAAIIALIGSFRIKEIRQEISSEKTHYEFTKEVFRYVLDNRLLSHYLITVLIISVTSEGFGSAFQSYFVLRDVPVVLFGVLYSLLAFSSAVGAFAYRKIYENVSWQQISALALLLTIIGLMLSRIDYVLMPFIIMVLSGFSFGINSPVSRMVIKENTRSKYRSTVSSVNQFMYLAGFAVVSVMVGYYVDNFGVVAMINIITLQAVILFGVFLIIVRKNLFSRTAK